MANLNDLIVNGVARIVGNTYSSGGFIGNLTGNVTGNVSGSSGSCTGNSATATNSSQLGGLSASTSATASTIVARNSSNYVYLNYINSNTSNGENPTISQIIVTNGSDHFYRKATLAHLKSSLGSMPASDVYAWAKASTKPTYTASEVGAAAASHGNHVPATQTANNAKFLRNDNTWQTVTPANIGAAAASHGNHVPTTCTSITDWNSATITGWYMATGASNAPTTGWYFGRVIAHNANYLVQEAYQFTASTDAKAIPKYIRAKMNGTWGSWTEVTVQKKVPSDAVFTDTNTWRGIQNNLTSDSTTDSLSAAQGKALKALIDGKAASSHGNHVPATQTANNAVFLRNDNTWQTVTPANIGAAASSHTHSYLPLSGGAMSGNIITPKDDNMGIIPDTNNYGQIGSSDKKFYRMYATTFYGNLSGNATSATKVANSLTIQTNGTSAGTFDGSSAVTVNITPSNIGAADSSHTHSYLPLSGGTINGALTVKSSSNSSAYVELAADVEGGNIRFGGKGGRAIEMDCSDNVNIRMFSWYGEAVRFAFNYNIQTDTFSVGNLSCGSISGTIKADTVDGYHIATGTGSASGGAGTIYFQYS